MQTKVRKIGNSLGITLPKQLMDQLHLKKGDTLTIETKEGILQLKPVDPEFEEWAEAYRQANTDYKEVLKDLANGKVEKKELAAYLKKHSSKR